MRDGERRGLQQECLHVHFQYKFVCGRDIYSGLKSKHVRIQALVSNYVNSKMYLKRITQMKIKTNLTF